MRPNTERPKQDFTVDFTLTTDKGPIGADASGQRFVHGILLYYKLLECTGCGSYFTRSDCDDAYKTTSACCISCRQATKWRILRPASTCVDKGTVEYWQCKLKRPL
ncbi:MAG: hypothetical protein ACLT0Y_01690 [Christensenellales bacterium]